MELDARVRPVSRHFRQPHAALSPAVRPDLRNHRAATIHYLLDAFHSAAAFFYRALVHIQNWDATFLTTRRCLGGARARFFYSAQPLRGSISCRQSGHAILVVMRDDFAWCRINRPPRAGGRSSPWTVFRRVDEVDGISSFLRCRSHAHDGNNSLGRLTKLPHASGQVRDSFSRDKPARARHSRALLRLEGGLAGLSVLRVGFQFPRR